MSLDVLLFEYIMYKKAIIIYVIKNFVSFLDMEKCMS